MNNTILIPISLIFGTCLILYGITRHEKKFNVHKNVIRKNVKITNEKAFIISNKVYFLIIGFLLILLALLVNMELLSDKGIALYFLSIFVFQLIIRLFIEIKYCKKSR